MAAAELKISEKAARRIFKDMKYDNWESMSLKKLEKGLANIRGDLNGETSIEELDISNQAKSTLEEIVDAIDDERGFTIVGESDEDKEEPKKRGRKPAAKTESKIKVKTKTPKKSEVKKEKKTSKKYDSEKASAYQEKRHEEGERIKKAISKGPKTVAEIAKLAKVTESRVESCIKFHNRGKKTPMFVIRKGKVVNQS